MRLVLPSLALFAACTSPLADAPDPPPASVRARLAEDGARLLMSAPDSAGTVMVQRKITNGWETGLADLAVEFGELAISADDAGDVSIEALSIALEPIEIPASVFNREAQLSHVRATLARPARVTTTWADDDTARLSATLDLAFAWSLTVEGNTSGLGAPDLPPLALAIEVTGDGTVVRASIRAGANGELWSWAGLIRLQDIALVLAAETTR